MRLQVRNLTRRFPTIVIAVAAISAVFAVLLGDVGDRYVFTFAGTGEAGAGGDGGLATEAQLSEPHGLALDGSGNLYVADSGNQRIRVIRPPGERNPVTNEFPHFANGDSTVSDLVLVNVDTKSVTPVVRFYSSEGNPISADSLLDVTGDLDATTDGALTVTAGIPPLAARTISTHGRGALTADPCVWSRTDTSAGFCASTAWPSAWREWELPNPSTTLYSRPAGRTVESTPGRRFGIWRLRP